MKNWYLKCSVTIVIPISYAFNFNPDILDLEYIMLQYYLTHNKNRQSKGGTVPASLGLVNLVAALTLPRYSDTSV